MSFFIIYPPISPDFTYLWDRKRKPNNRMQLLYVIGTGVLAAFCVLLAVRICYQRRYIRTSDRINDCIFRNVAAYLLLIDPDFNVLQTNYRSATGTAPKAVPPKVGNLLRCRNGEDAGVCGTHELCADCPVRAAITGVFRTKKGFSGLEVPMVLYTSDDHTETVDCDVSVAGNFLTVAGQPRVVLTVSDISAQKRTQRELEKARVRAEESDRMKSRFLANMSHELRTPLNAIIGFSELLMDDPAPTEKQEYMRIIRSNGEVLMQQLSDILDLSKIEAGTLGYEYTDVELNAVMEELEGGFRMQQPKNSPVRITPQEISRPLHPHGPQAADSGDRQLFEQRREIHLRRLRRFRIRNPRRGTLRLRRRHGSRHPRRTPGTAFPTFRQGGIVQAGHRHRTGDLEVDRRNDGRPHRRRIPTGQRLDLLVHASLQAGAISIVILFAVSKPSRPCAAE